MVVDVKKILVCIIGILVIISAAFFGGYSYGRTRFDDSRITADTELIKQQDITIKNIKTGIEQSIGETGIIKDEIEQASNSANIIDSGLRDIENGLSTDINGISGVIERLQYYRGQGEVLEENNSGS